MKRHTLSTFLPRYSFITNGVRPTPHLGMVATRCCRFAYGRTPRYGLANPPSNRRSKPRRQRRTRPLLPASRNGLRQMLDRYHRLLGYRTSNPMVLQSWHPRRTPENVVLSRSYRPQRRLPRPRNAMLRPRKLLHRPRPRPSPSAASSLPKATFYSLYTIMKDKFHFVKEPQNYIQNSAKQKELSTVSQDAILLA